MAKSITLEQTGWEVSGEVYVTLWGSGGGVIHMTPSFVPLGQLTRDNIHRSINDGRFGVQSIDRADVEISEVYGNPSFRESCVVSYRATLDVRHPNPDMVCRGIA